MKLKEGDIIKLIGHDVIYRVERECGNYSPICSYHCGVKNRAYIVSDETGNFYHITNWEIGKVVKQ